MISRQSTAFTEISASNILMSRVFRHKCHQKREKKKKTVLQNVFEFFNKGKILTKMHLPSNHVQGKNF